MDVSYTVGETEDDTKRMIKDVAEMAVKQKKTERG